MEDFWREEYSITGVVLDSQKMVIMKSRLTLVSFIVVFRSSRDNAAFTASTERGEGGLSGPFPQLTLGTSMPVSEFHFCFLLLRYFGLVSWPLLAQNFGLRLWFSLPKSTNLDSCSNCLPFWPPDLACVFVLTQLSTPNPLPTCALAICFFTAHHPLPLIVSLIMNTWLPDLRGLRKLSFLSSWTPGTNSILSHCYLKSKVAITWKASVWWLWLGGEGGLGCVLGLRWC